MAAPSGQRWAALRAHEEDTMKSLSNPRTLTFVGLRSGRPTVLWSGVAMGFGVYALAVAAAGLFGWYLLALATGADFGRGLPFVLAFAVSGAGAVVASVVKGSLRRPVSELPTLA